ncbi:hypothetical protein [Cellulomonas taurus]|uniref:hypothetical protein n=1 Tax=Cellulomonas taurus TaxID=2729175 RepID=UPI00145E8565|nr:hypothetical protein [Cellulomonas taurus]
MTTVTVVGTGGGVGVTTLAALAFAALRDHPQGAPWLIGAPEGDLVQRAGGDQVPRVRVEHTVRDAGVLRADAPVAGLIAEGSALAVATPWSPIGLADARAVVDRVSAVDPTAVRRTAVVLVGRRGWRGGRNGADAWPDAVPVLHLPYDPALHRPGPVPGPDALGRAGREGVAAWQELVARLLG